MDAMEAILTRRSIRSYSDAAVSDEDVRAMLGAAMSAPSAGNQQPWEFVVVNERAVLDAIPGFHPYSKMLLQAPLAILVCVDPGRERYAGCGVLDCSAATQNLLLAAHALGLGAVWLGVHPYAERMEPMRRLLGIPERIIPLALICVGHTTEKAGRTDRFDPARIRYNSW